VIIDTEDLGELMVISACVLISLLWIVAPIQTILNQEGLNFLFDPRNLCDFCSPLRRGRNLKNIAERPRS
jgi:hypothetical protein